MSRRGRPGEDLRGVLGGRQRCPIVHRRGRSAEKTPPRPPRPTRDLGSRRGRSAENTFAGHLRGRREAGSSSSMSRRGRPGEDLRGVLGGRRGPVRDALSSSLRSRRGRSAENTFVSLLRGRPRSRLVELDVPPRTAGEDLRGVLGGRQRCPIVRAWGPAADGPPRTLSRDFSAGRPSPMPAAGRLLRGRQRSLSSGLGRLSREFSAAAEGSSSLSRRGRPGEGGSSRGRQRCPIVRLGVPPRKVRREHFRGTSPRPAEKPARRARCPAADGPGKTFAEFSAAGKMPIVQGVPPRKVRREDFRGTSAAGREAGSSSSMSRRGRPAAGRSGPARPYRA